MARGSAYVLTLIVLGLAMLAVAASVRWERFPPAAYAASSESARHGQEDSLRRAVFADGRLWLLADDGRLFTVREHVAGADRISTPEVVLDICAEGDGPLIATTPRDQQAAWTLRRWRDGRWADVAIVPVLGESLVAITCERGRISLLTSRRVVEIMGSSRRVVTLSNRLPVRPVSVVLATPGYLFLGLNAGEWGGGLQRIDTRTGDVRQLEQNATGELCGGPLNTECDPVNGIANSPWQADCVVAAVGLVHMTAHGRLVEVCGDRVTGLHSEPCPDDRSNFCTMPFFGVIAANGGLLAVAPGELVRLDRRRQTTHLPEPRLEAYGPFRVAFAPSYVLVETSANERHSLSGLTPLIAAR